MATLIHTDGSQFEVAPKDGQHFTLDEMYEMLHCSLVQVIYLADGNLMYLDEEGKFKNPCVPNDTATRLLVQAGGMPGDFIAGHALVCTPEEVR